MTMTKSNRLQLEDITDALEGKDIPDESKGGIITVKGLPGYMNLLSYLDKTLNDPHFKTAVDVRKDGQDICISNQYMRANVKPISSNGTQFYRSSVHFNAPNGANAPSDLPFVILHSAEAVFPTFSDIGLNEDGKFNMINGVGTEIYFRGIGTSFTESHKLNSPTFEIKEGISSRQMQELIITPKEYNPEITPDEFEKTLSELTLITNDCLRDLKSEYGMKHMQIEF